MLDQSRALFGVAAARAAGLPVVLVQGGAAAATAPLRIIQASASRDESGKLTLSLRGHPAKLIYATAGKSSVVSFTRFTRLVNVMDATARQTSITCCSL